MKSISIFGEDVFVMLQPSLLLGSTQGTIRTSSAAAKSIKNKSNLREYFVYIVRQGQYLIKT